MTAENAASPPLGATHHPDGSCTWRVWAPLARSVHVVFPDAPGGPQEVRLESAPLGRWHVTLPDVEEGRRYLLRLDDASPLPDPASAWQPDGVHGPSAVFDPARFAWTDSDWKGVARTDLAIYELHVGTFTPEGTFDAVAASGRLQELRELGIAAIELMPTAQFPGSRNWGYDGVYWNAVQNSYGGPRALQRLVDAAHANGLAVFLDVVYNHFGPEGNYAGKFGPFLVDRYKTPWGNSVNYDHRGCDEVRQFALDDVRRWLRDFHVDGLRIDAAHVIFDASPKHILAEIQQVAVEEEAESGRRLHVIAESDLNDVRLLRPPREGGFGCDAQWSDDFHHAVHCLLTGERDGYYVDFDRPAEQLAKALRDVFVYDGCYSVHRGRRRGAPADGVPGDRFVVCVQNHDQVGNRAHGDRLSTLVEPPKLRLAASLLLFAPHIPLLFMGEEYGETNPFPFFCDFGDPALTDAVRRGRRREFAEFHDFGRRGEVPDPADPATFASAKLSWSWPEGSPRAGLRRLYQDLLAARRVRAPMRDFERRDARLYAHDAGGYWLHLVRGEGGQASPANAPERLDVWFNLTSTAAAAPIPPEPSVPAALTTWFRSESTRYGGDGSGEASTAASGVLWAGPFECLALEPPPLARR